MNRVDRLFALLLVFQHRQRVTAAQLARQFEVSERTVDLLRKSWARVGDGARAVRTDDEVEPRAVQAANRGVPRNLRGDARRA
ncbi:HTH domain-containing protein [Deinococcus peraridilitoris]|uniref:HTH domain-containing protein n=1 Tax=Deinococcus peraridilitoris TaxID=432329 RepID=UPI0009FD13F9